MRFIAVTLLFICLALSSRGQNQPLMKNDLKTEGLKGRVKAVTTRGFRAEKGGGGTVTKGGLVHTTIKKYSQAGYLLESVSSIGGSRLPSGMMMPYRSAKIVYKYDNLNNLVGSVSYNTQGQLEDSSIHYVDKSGNRLYWQIYKGNGYQEWQYISEYDNQGSLLETNDFHFGKQVERHVYRYNDRMKCVMETDYLPDARIKTKKTYKYDDRWNKVEEEVFNGGGGFEVKHTYKYDEDNRVIEEREYKTDGSDAHTRITTSYDFLGNVEELKQYNAAGRMVYYGHFDRYGNHLADISYNDDGVIREKITASYKYDEFDNEIEELLQLSDKMIPLKTVSKYEYDYPGNWIRKTVYEDGDPVRIAEREIEYYN